MKYDIQVNPQVLVLQLKALADQQDLSTVTREALLKSALLLAGELAIPEIIKAHNSSAGGAQV